MNAIDIFRLLDDCGISDEKLETWSKEDLLSLFYEIYWSLEDRFGGRDES